MLSIIAVRLIFKGDDNYAYVIIDALWVAHSHVFAIKADNMEISVENWIIKSLYSQKANYQDGDWNEYYANAAKSVIASSN